MKRWFCGFSAIDDHSLATLPKPLDGEMLWEGSKPFWVCGTWGKQQIITIFEGPVRLAIVGTCLAPYKTLVELFQNAVRNKDYSQLMRSPGSYNLIVQDETDTYIFVDVAGLKPVFYTKYESSIVYSSLGVPLQQLIKAEVDPCWLANSLSGLTAPNLVQNRSPFRNIQTVPSGHYLQISSGQPTCKKYWNAPQEYISFSDAAEQLHEQLLTAVEGRVRLYGNVTSDLSGGFDSTSLALIAAKDLAKRGHNLHTITIKGTSSTESEDVKWAKHAASLYPNISSIMIDSHEYPAELSNLESIPLTDAPDPSVFSLGLINYSMGVVKSKGSKLHMSGEGGDPVLGSHPSYLADLVRRMQVRTFVQHIYGLSRVNDLSPIALMNSAVKLSITSYRQWLLQQARKLLTGRSHQPLRSKQPLSTVIGWHYTLNPATWYTKSFVDLVVTELQKWAAVATPLDNSPGEHSSIDLIQGTGFTSLIQQQLAAIYDVNLEFPYFDSLVIDACLSAKPEERTTPFAYKPLLSKALERDLPKSIFTRTTKGDYTGGEFVGLQQNLPMIKEFFQTSFLADMGLIDIREFRNYIQQLSMGLATGSFHFNQTLAIELWLRRVVDAKNSFWEHSTLNHFTEVLRTH
ncbi:albusnodin/ikarugamycin family macrolactam cyclase [Nostoc sp. MG11]|uniref:albusnodin/ikarugamycin family macrolactam cyclase n=1 Tax=Nostoc sp. MG11 TaxID=2721166 RepID=UPI001866FF2C|nr:albusnodin/ikarugamycin family macrolactam cyclase [Nostoc sp. MG11]